ncbi:MAG: hypothetical protein CMN30_11430 [Sandaracinus sp.]|nr:hypothetical protein [Sandaracinus sp.]
MRRALLALIGFAGLVAPSTPAAADEASGTVTGTVEVLGNYYWERSTRVVAPAVSATLELPTGGYVEGAYLVDSITSASQAAGLIEDVSFTEIRHQVSLGGGYEFDLGDAELLIGGSYRVSREPDYLSNGVGLAAALSLAQRTTILRFNVGYLHDEVRKVNRGLGGAAMEALTFDENFDALVLSISWEQILSPTTYFEVGYQYGHLNGFLANAYRQVRVGAGFFPEQHPDVRHRYTLMGHLAHFVRGTRTGLHLFYRAYLDNWGVGAVTPEARVYQEISRFAQARIRYRYYRQSRSFFYQDEYDIDTTPADYVTADPKMSAFHSHLLGFQLAVRLAFLGDTALDALRDAWLQTSFEYLWQTSRFGNAVIAQAGIRVPF